MIIRIGADHAGVELKRHLVSFLKSQGLQVVDEGTHSSDSCDYPLIAQDVSKKLLEGSKEDRGILICGSGIGMSIAANKVKGIRAAVVSEPQSAALAREHNNAQILCLGARIIDAARAEACVTAFLNAKFASDHPRHQRRIDQIAQIEKDLD